MHDKQVDIDNAIRVYSSTLYQEILMFTLFVGEDSTLQLVYTILAFHTNVFGRFHICRVSMLQFI